MKLKKTKEKQIRRQYVKAVAVVLLFILKVW